MMLAVQICQRKAIKCFRRKDKSSQSWGKKLYAEFSKICNKNHTCIHEIVKQRREIHARFASTPLTAKMLDTVCLVKMGKTLHFWNYEGWTFIYLRKRVSVCLLTHQMPTNHSPLYLTPLRDWSKPEVGNSIQVSQVSGMDTMLEAKTTCHCKSLDQQEALLKPEAGTKPRYCVHGMKAY